MFSKWKQSHLGDHPEGTLNTAMVHHCWPHCWPRALPGLEERTVGKPGAQGPAPSQAPDRATAVRQSPRHLCVLVRSPDPPVPGD